MILAAGRGERMRPLTDHTPKPLLEVGGKPLIVWHIENLKKAGFIDIVINIAWLGDKITAALGDGSKLGVNLQYSDEQNSNEKNQGALETAGGIIKALPLLCGELGNEPFLVVNGDVWCNFPYSNICPFQSDGKGDLAHLILVNNPEHNPAGDFALNESRLSDSRLSEEGDNKFTFSGIAYYHPDLFKNLEPGKRPLAPLLREKIRENKVSGELFTDDWRDIGTPERLEVLNLSL